MTTGDVELGLRRGVSLFHEDGRTFTMAVLSDGSVIAGVNPADDEDLAGTLSVALSDEDLETLQAFIGAVLAGDRLQAVAPVTVVQGAPISDDNGPPVIVVDIAGWDPGHVRILRGILHELANERHRTQDRTQDRAPF